MSKNASSQNLHVHAGNLVMQLFDPNKEPGTNTKNNSENRQQRGKALDISLVIAKGPLQLPRPLSEMPMDSMSL